MSDDRPLLTSVFITTGATWGLNQHCVSYTVINLRNENLQEFFF